MLPNLAAAILIADKALDAEQRVRAPLARAGQTAVIPPKANRTAPRVYDKNLYAARHLIEAFFAKLKQCRAIATRYDKPAHNFLAAIHLAAAAAAERGRAGASVTGVGWSSPHWSYDPAAGVSLPSGVGAKAAT